MIQQQSLDGGRKIPVFFGLDIRRVGLQELALVARVNVLPPGPQIV